MSEAEEKNMDKINELIRDISRGAAFSSDAMAQFVELQSEVDDQESTIKFLRNEREKDKNKIGDLTSDMRTIESVLEERNHEIKGWLARENELKDREEQRVRQEVELAYEKQRVEDHQNMVGLIFRNTELRKKFVGQEMHHNPGCVEIKDEYGNIRQYAESAGFVGVPVEKTETKTEE